VATQGLALHPEREGAATVGPCHSSALPARRSRAPLAWRSRDTPPSGGSGSRQQPAIPLGAGLHRPGPGIAVDLASRPSPHGCVGTASGSSALDRHFRCRCARALRQRTGAVDGLPGSHPGRGAVSDPLESGCALRGCMHASFADPPGDFSPTCATGIAVHATPLAHGDRDRSGRTLSTSTRHRGTAIVPETPGSSFHPGGGTRARRGTALAASARR